MLQTALSDLYVELPEAWPSAPEWLSFSALSQVEKCPKRWSLTNGVYPSVWNRKGYPEALNSGALKGLVIHKSLETILKAFANHGCSSVEDAKVVTVLKGLGGFTSIISDAIESELVRLQDNPRALPRLDSERRKLEGSGGEIRVGLQAHISRLRLIPRLKQKVKGRRHSGGQSTRRPLNDGAYSEVELRSPALKWRGFADLITLTPNDCEIRDFKSGAEKEENKLQLYFYALIWQRDSELNPSGRRVDRLVLSYESGDVEVPILEPNEFAELERDLRQRDEAVREFIEQHPPLALPSTENCSFCSVRHLCDEYWTWLASDASAQSGDDFVDVQLEVVGSNGVTSWDTVIESSAACETGTPIVLRTGQFQAKLEAGQRLRVLNARLREALDDTVDLEMGSTLTMVASSEIFFVP